MRSVVWVLGALIGVAAAQGKLESVAIQGRANELALVDVDGDTRLDLVVSGHTDSSRLIYWVKTSPTLALRPLSVPAEATVAAVGDVLPEPGPEIIYLGRDAILAANLRSGGATSVLARVPLFFDLPDGRLPLAELAADLDGDGRDDLVVPTPSGYALWLAAAPGSTTPIPGPIEQWIGQEYGSDQFLAVTFTAPNLAALDLDGDDRRELVYLHDGALGIFSGAAGQAPVNLRREDASALGVGIKSTSDDALERHRLLVADVDGDRRADYITATNSGKISQLGSWGTRVAIYLNRGDGRVAERPDALLKVPGIAFTPRLVDYDTDGDLDLVLSTVRTDLATGISAATLKKLVMSYQAYPWDAGKLAQRPELARDLEVPLDGAMERDVMPFGFLHGDYDGDGKRDLLVLGDGRFEIFRGGTGGGGWFSSNDGFADKPTWTVPAEVSNRVTVADLDADGKSEVVILGRGKILVWRPEGL